MKTLRYIAAQIAAHVIIAPLVALWLTCSALEGISHAIKWCAVDREWTAYLFALSDSVEQRINGSGV